MKSLKSFILLGIILASFEAFGQFSRALTIIEGDAGRALLNQVTESNPAAREFFARTLGIKVSDWATMDSSLRQALLINRFNVQSSDQQALVEKVRGFILETSPTSTVDLSLTSPASPESETRTPIQINIELGDMTEKKADAYVVPHFNNGASYDGVGGAVFERGGQDGINAFDSQLRALGQAEFGSVFSTQSGGGNAPHLLNVVSLGSGAKNEARIITLAMYNALVAAYNMGLKTIAAPALGTGDAGQLTAEESARAMMEGIEQFSNEMDRLRLVLSVQEVTIVIDEDRAAYESFLKIKSESEMKPARPASGMGETLNSGG